MTIKKILVKPAKNHVGCSTTKNQKSTFCTFHTLLSATTVHSTTRFVMDVFPTVAPCSDGPKAFTEITGTNGTLTRDSPMVDENQPGVLVELHPCQRRSIYALQECFKRVEDGFRVFRLEDMPGAGKSLVCLACISSGVMCDIPPIHPSSTVVTVPNLVQYSVPSRYDFTEIENVHAIVLPNAGIHTQWMDYINEQTSIDSFIPFTTGARVKKWFEKMEGAYNNAAEGGEDVASCFQEYLKDSINNTIFVVASAALKELHAALCKYLITFTAIWLDECDSCSLPKTINTRCFKVFVGITGTGENNTHPSGKKVNGRKAIKGMDTKSGFWKNVMSAMAGSPNRAEETRTCVVRNPDELVIESFGMYAPTQSDVVCTPSRVIDVILSNIRVKDTCPLIINPNVTEAIDCEDVSELCKLYDAKTGTTKELLVAMQEVNDFEMRDLTRRKVRARHSAPQNTKITATARQSFSSALISLVSDITDDTALMCTCNNSIDPDPATTTKCTKCLSTICMPCHLPKVTGSVRNNNRNNRNNNRNNRNNREAATTHYAECPRCLNRFDAGTFTRSPRGPAKDLAGGGKGTKWEKMMHIVLSNKEKKVLTFATCAQGSFTIAVSALKTSLGENSVAQIIGTKKLASRALPTLREFCDPKSKLNVLVLSPDQGGRGYNIQITDIIIIYQKMTSDVRDQIKGRVRGKANVLIFDLVHSTTSSLSGDGAELDVGVGGGGDGKCNNDDIDIDNDS